jgi:cytidine deaminase
MMKVPHPLAFFSSIPFLPENIPVELSSELVQKAMEAQKQAYAPYSHYFVGAAILTRSEKIFLGCNVENASYGLCNCAERTAVFKAISEGEKEFKAIAIVTRDGGMPCGACRQVLNEFNPQMHVIAADEKGLIRYIRTLDQLLPYAFGPANLK